MRPAFHRRRHRLRQRPCLGRFAPGGATLAVGTSSTTNTFTLWNVSNFAHPRQLSEPLAAGSGDTVESVAFSWTAQTRAPADGEEVALWAVSNPAAPQHRGPPLATGSGASVSSGAFSPD